jgi:hypothetical protein
MPLALQPVVVDNAGTALPVVVDRIRSSGTEVESARELRLSFDETFAILVNPHVTRTAADGSGDSDRHDAGSGSRTDANGRTGSEAA